MKIKRLTELNSLSGKRELARTFRKKQCSQNSMRTSKPTHNGGTLRLENSKLWQSRGKFDNRTRKLLFIFLLSNPVTTDPKGEALFYNKETRRPLSVF